MTAIGSRPGSLVIGVGNPLRGDDGVGPALAEALGAALGPGWEVLPFSGSGLDLVTALVGRERVVVIDALVDASVPTGECCRIDPPDLPGSGSPPSSHATGVLEGLALARRMGVDLPPRLAIFGVGVDATTLSTYHEGLSGPLAARLPAIVRQICSELASGQWP